jgi:hypothetical protein
MKNIALISAILIFIVGCEKENNHHSSGIIIKGKIPESKLKNSNFKTANALSLSDAKKVMLFNRNRMTLFDINDNSFSVSAEMGTGIALLFLDADNRYIGNLSSKGLNMLPLGNLSNGENTVIDLSVLRLEGTNVIPSHDPLGNEIIISTAEINSLKVLGEYYESLAKNIDTDNDGLPDILSKKELMVSSIFGFTNCGRWGHNDTVPRINDISNIFVNYQMNIIGGQNLSYSDNNIFLSGPSGDPYSDIIIGAERDIHQGGFYSWSRRPSKQVPEGFPHGEILLPFKKGMYTLTLDGKDYTFNYANIDAFYNLIMIVPTVHTNNEGLITSVSMEYRLVEGPVLSNPANLVTNVWCQIVDQMGTYYDIYHGNDPGGPNSRLSAETGYSAVVPTSPVNIPAPFHMVSISYDDLLGNNYIIIWNSKR